MEVEVEVVVPLPSTVDFNFDSNCSSPYMTAPSSPQRFGNFFLSAPTSPTRASTFYRDLRDVSLSSSSSNIRFNWEEKPGTPKSRNERDNNNNTEDQVFNDDGDFEFDFSGQLDRTSLSADELFDGGKIRPLKPPPGYASSVSSPKSSPKSRKKDFDPFQAALEETRRKEPGNQERGRHRTISGNKEMENQENQERGRERNIKHKASRSLSPFRVSDLMFDQEDNYNSNNSSQNVKVTKPSYASTFLSAISFSSKGYKKWKLKDLLLFRSASEGRATANNKDPLTKYVVLSKKEAVVEDAKNASFRSADSSIGGSSRRRGPVSAHELHYTANRAVSEELKRKTFLPYKQGLLGCLGFNPGVHEISRGVGSLTRV
ncbi:hypothetical protein JCGZ_04865 [Jatropha curcas]|uniref:Calmodulin-binding protein n=1 Tax=Jatropha curcas TaxID=180498 RepID=A0A067KQ50_JATCU|nr:uncharacterized protein LOC105634219 [Jatropha curcas]KDP38222.1 hypothetical protein JCGZ_04865 [Jatropha curcas]